ncbi:hypothetical protein METBISCDRAFT_28930 [Metschnikowia bicuspidata]|uniref:Uncharacterized protein n=1 Tax=Metschnikowia bicuspidata TaxID=27322 RepID=A0A4P9Z7I5_9ASCO|nr:hypothetical protein METBISCDRAFT_28930 [Metschnikowia bicuspidata]
MSFNMEDFGEETMNEIRRRQGVKNVWRADNLQKRELALPENVKQHLTPDLTSAVKELHYRGITGRGIVIGHLFLQFDENHPALEGKALFGADYCASLNDLPHSDGSQKEASMTIASIMVGKSTEYTGVAPDG